MIILDDIFQAYYDCRKNKSKTINALNFEIDYEEKLIDLYNDIISKTYKVGKSIAFIVDKPCKREIFSGDFRDRIVHHLVYNKINYLFEKEFIYDSYSCRVGKGVLFGVNRATNFMRKVSENYKKEAYVMKLDISGFFMSINKDILFKKLQRFLIEKYIGDDLDLILFLIKEIIYNKPSDNCIIKGNKNSWVGLPKNKSLFFVGESKGLPIGNLTSQIFGNFYLNELDHFIKSELGIKYYGRYVDDMIFFHQDKQELLDIKTKIQQKLNEIGLQLNHKKTYLQNINHGVLFLGSYILPYRNYVGNRTKGNFNNLIDKINNDYKYNLEKKDYRPNINSYLGTVKNMKTYNFRKKILFTLPANFYNDFYISSGYQKVKFKNTLIFN